MHWAATGRNIVSSAWRERGPLHLIYTCFTPDRPARPSRLIYTCFTPDRPAGPGAEAAAVGRLLQAEARPRGGAPMQAARLHYQVRDMGKYACLLQAGARHRGGEPMQAVRLHFQVRDMGKYACLLQAGTRHRGGAGSGVPM